MNSTRFDQICKDVRNRRHLLAALIASASGALVAARPAGGKGKGKGKGKQKSRCDSHRACPKNEVCRGGHCQVGCAVGTKENGPTGMTCSPETGRCTVACEYAGYYGPYREPPTCPFGQTCHQSGPASFAQGWCGTPCGGASPCPRGYECLPDLSACILNPDDF
jgi:hypothetical protein